MNLINFRFKVMNTQALSTAAIGVFLALALGGCTSIKPLIPVPLDAGTADLMGNDAEIFTSQWNPLPGCVSFKQLSAVKTGADLRADLAESIKVHLLSKGYKMAANDQPCDYQMDGEITHRDKGFFGVFSRSTLGAVLELKRVSSAQRMWRSKQMVDFSDGAVPFSLLGISSGIYKASDNLSREKELMAMDNLARKLTSSLPYLPEPQKLSRSGSSRWPEGLDKWLENQPEIDRPQLLRAALKNDVLSGQEAEMAYARLCKLESVAANWRGWAQLRLSAGDKEGALTVLSKGIQSSLPDPDGYFLKGRILASLSRFQEADEALIQSISINADNPLYYEALAYVNTSRGNYERALAAYKKIVAITPGEPFAYKNLAELSLKLGDVDSSMRYFETASRLYADGGSKDKVLEIRNALTNYVSSTGDSSPLARQVASQVAEDLKRVVAP
jgi:tetratricopeptide (TPR) repeat protein